MNPIILKVAIAEPNIMLRLGLEAMLKKLSGYKVQTLDITDSIDQVIDQLSLQGVDILFVNPLISGLSLSPSYTPDRHIRVVALLDFHIDSSFLKGYDDSILISDSMERLSEILDKLLSVESGEAGLESQALTTREKEIVVCVVKGMTNKQIADSLFLSIHTVITHRRNIAKKLEIHSTSGLTIYAIVNKLVELNEISQ
ncbi:LuxR family transcriptional regulator [Porphyromonas crevioricanis JCM 15906]|uniref:LuxR family transcriptional regulator n=1 Tax=Porphyromonas crevioricanis JCM 15906 TaxID=1305617 RepID=T1CNT3_9PORP|nr:response regulator transcription factor [Porphyromonas crevioricanis]GAD04758.1 LuxR family transcriptional regulator [Porphyromonas crevioricanis JCM 15906]SJZ65846.1 DNA-binding response regulator, NarL/FixJ family, contains REC and HTH domains [Porphyromonas crevioricanis]